MPKETIRSDDSTFAFQVCWGQDGGAVQVGAVTADGSPLLDAMCGQLPLLAQIGERIVTAFGIELQEELDLHPTARYQHVGRRVLDEIFEAIRGSEGSYEGVWSFLRDRRDVNRAIAVLRRARDVAFGRDQ